MQRGARQHGLKLRGGSGSGLASLGRGFGALKQLGASRPAFGATLEAVPDVLVVAYRGGREISRSSLGAACRGVASSLAGAK
jgi:hypothetical protein